MLFRHEHRNSWTHKTRLCCAEHNKMLKLRAWRYLPSPYKLLRVFDAHLRSSDQPLSCCCYPTACAGNQGGWGASSLWHERINACICVHVRVARAYIYECLYAFNCSRWWFWVASVWAGMQVHTSRLWQQLRDPRSKVRPVGEEVRAAVR